MLGVIIAVGVGVGLWLFGLLGYTLGYAPSVRLPDLDCSIATAFAAAFRVVMATPNLIVEAGVGQTPLMMLGFLIIALPAAGLSAIRPFPPGGPRPPMIAQVFSWIGAFSAMLIALLLVVWTNADARTARIADLPGVAPAVAEWETNLRIVAGLDALAVIALALWAVLTMQLVIPRWLRALSASFAFTALVLMTMSFATSGVTATQVSTERSVCLLDGAPPAQQWRLVLGHRGPRIATIVGRGDLVVVELHDVDGALYVHERASIPSFLAPTVERPTSSSP